MFNFTIERWDSVIFGKNQEPMPMIYFRPNEEFLKEAKNNKYTGLVTIKNSNSTYDNRPLIGTIDNSGYFPNYRPNFYNETGLFVIVLGSAWFGYPYKKGTVHIEFDTNNSYKKHYEYVNSDQKIVEKKKKLSNNQLIMISVVIILIFCILLVFSMK